MVFMIFRQAGTRSAICISEQGFTILVFMKSIREISMNVKNKTIAAFLGLGLMATPAFANAGSLKDKLDNIQVSGFVDTSYSGSNAGAPTTKGFGLDQVELDVEYHEGNVGLRFDLNASPSTAGNVTNNSLFEQGYITYSIPGLSLLDEDGLTFTFGKFNAPIGWELLDAPDMYQFSHALVFNYGLPTNLTGAMLSGSAGMVDASVYYTGGLDLNGTTAGGAKTFGGRLGVTPIEGVNVGFSYIQDKNTNGIGASALKITDIDATINLIENLLIGAEYNETKNMQGAGIRTKGFMLMSHYDFSDMFGATVRYDYFDFDRATAGKSTAYTGAITAALGGGLGALVEVRTDKNGSAVLDPNNTPANKNVTSYAFEMTYGF